VVIAAGFTGGVISEVFDPETNTWNRTGSVAEMGRFNFYFSELPNGRGLIAGGQVPYTHGSSSSLSKQLGGRADLQQPVHLRGQPRDLWEPLRRSAGAGGNTTGGSEVYIPSCNGIPANITIYCSPN
jgi:hypothetical protein